MTVLTAKIELELSINTWTDYTAHVWLPGGIEWASGKEPKHQMPFIGWLRFAFRNKDGAFSVGHGSCTSGFAEGVRIRLILNDTSNNLVYFYGTIATIHPDRAPSGEWLAWIHAHDHVHEWHQAKIVPNTPQQNVLSSDLAADVLNMAGLRAATLGFWTIGTSNYAKINRKVIAVTRGMTINTGTQTFTWAWDRWEGGLTNVYQAARDVILSEGGECWVDVDGTIIVNNRLEKASHRTVAAIFTEGQILYDPAATVTIKERLSQITTIIHPRVEGASVVTLGELNATAKLPADGIPVKWAIRYRDLDNPDIRVRGYDLQRMIYPTDIEFNRARDGTGADVASEVTWSEQPGADVTIVTAKNKGPYNVYRIKLQKRGKRLDDFQPEPIYRENTDRIEELGRHHREIDLAFQDSPYTAWGIAGVALMVSGREPDIPTLWAEASRNATIRDKALELKVGNRIAATHAQAGWSAKEFFVENHKGRIDKRGRIFLGAQCAAANAFMFWCPADKPGEYPIFP